MSDAMQSRASVARTVLREWAQTRGPLFADPLYAAVRALAFAEVTVLSLESEWGTAMGAADTLGIHGRPVRAAKFGASAAQLSRAQHLLRVLIRLSQGWSRRGRKQPVTSLHRALVAVPGTPRSFDRSVALVGWARLVFNVLRSPEDALRLRAARTLLHWTWPDARKVGHAPRGEEDSDAESPDSPAATPPGFEPDDPAPLTPPPAGDIVFETPVSRGRAPP